MSQKMTLVCLSIIKKVKLPSLGRIGGYYFRFIRICSSNVGMQKLKLCALIRIILGRLSANISFSLFSHFYSCSKTSKCSLIGQVGQKLVLIGWWIFSGTMDFNFIDKREKLFFENFDFWQKCQFCEVPIRRNFEIFWFSGSLFRMIIFRFLLKDSHHLNDHLWIIGL